MGIRGLSTYIAPAGRRETLTRAQMQGRSDRLLLVDGSQILFHLCSSMEFVDVELASYHMLRTRIIEFISVFLAVGFELHFYFDGMLSMERDDKSGTFKKRQEQRIQSVSTLSVDQGVTSYPTDFSTKPKQANWLFKSVLRELGCTCFYCEGESDPIMAAYALSHSHVFGILSNDTDFLFFPTRIIPLYSLQLEENLSDKMESKIHLEIFTSDRVARYLDVKEDHLFLFSAIAGNDFSGPILASDGSIYKKLSLNPRQVSRNQFFSDIASTIRSLTRSNNDVEKIFQGYNDAFVQAVKRTKQFYTSPESLANGASETVKSVLTPLKPAKTVNSQRADIPFELITVDRVAISDLIEHLSCASFFWEFSSRSNINNRTEAVIYRRKGMDYVKSIVPLQRYLPDSYFDLKKDDSFSGTLPACKRLYLPLVKMQGVRPRTVKTALVHAVNELSMPRLVKSFSLQHMVVSSYHHRQPLSTRDFAALLLTCLFLDSDYRTFTDPLQSISTSAHAYPTGDTITLHSYYNAVLYKILRLLRVRLSDQQELELGEPDLYTHGPLFQHLVETLRYVKLPASSMQNAETTLDCITSLVRLLLRQPPSDGMKDNMRLYLSVIFYPYGTKPSVCPFVDERARSITNLTAELTEHKLNLSFGTVRTPVVKNGSKELHIAQEAEEEADFQEEVRKPVESPLHEEPAPEPTGMTVLPVLEHREKIIDSIRQHRIVAIQGDTGCGKSSQVPQFALQEATERFKKQAQRPRVIVTQPRRIAAISLAKRVASETRSPVGGLVGYRIGQEVKAGKHTQLLYVTSGWLLEKLIYQPEYLSQCTHLILDEIHERSIDNDLLNLMVRQLLHQQKGSMTRLIVMSATFDIGLFATYFKTILPAPQEVPQLFVGVKRYPVEIVYLDRLTRHSLFQTKAMQANSSAIQKICGSMTVASQAANRMKGMQKVIPDMIEALAHHHKNDKAGNTILVFLPGLQEIESLDEVLQSMFSLPTWDEDAGAAVPVQESRQDIDIEVCLLHSLIEESEQMKVFSPLAPGLTRVILASNIAESSVTLPQTRYIIDLGLVRQIEFDIQTGVTALNTAWVSHASANQRSGRCGRLFPGVTFRMYSEEFFKNTMRPYDIPEMLRLSLSSTVLRLKNLSDHITSDSPLADPRQSLRNALQPPENAAIDRAVSDLIDNDVFRLHAPMIAPYLAPEEIKKLADMRGDQAIRLVDRLNGEHPEKNLDVLRLSQVTDLGKFLAHLPFDLRLGRLVAMGARCGRFVCHALLVATELSSVNSIYLMPYVRSNTSAAEHEKCARIAVESQKKRHRDVDLLSDAFLVIRVFREHFLSERGSRSQPGLHQSRYHRLLNSVQSIARKLEEILPHHRQWLKIFNRNQNTSTDEFNQILSFQMKDINLMRLLMAMAFKNDGLVKVTYQQKTIPPPSHTLEKLEHVEKRIAMVESVPQAYRNNNAIRQLVPLLIGLPETVHFPPHPSSQVCLVFPQSKTVEGLYVAPTGLRVWSTFMKKRRKLTVEAHDNTMVTLDTLSVPYKTTWRYQRGACRVDDHSVLGHLIPEKGTSVSLCAIPGTIQHSNRSVRMDRLTLIPPEPGLNALILLLVHRDSIMDPTGSDIRRVKLHGETFTFSLPLPVDVLRSEEIAEFARLESNILETRVDSATLSELDEHKLAALLNKISHQCAEHAKNDESESSEEEEELDE